MSGSVVDGMFLESDEDEGGPVPVGITIAYKQQQGGFIEDEKPLRQASDSTATAHPIRLFFESSFLYACCIIVPTLLSYYVNVWKYERINLHHSYLTSAYQSLVQTVHEPLLHYCCVEGYLHSLFGSFCPDNEEPMPESSVISKDVNTWSDAFTIFVYSVLLAIIRTIIVKVTIHLDDTETVEAMVRCKSSHLLSSDYVVTPTGTPRPSLRNVRDLSGAPPTMPDLSDAFRKLDKVNMQPLATGVPKEVPASPLGARSRKYAAPRCATAIFRAIYSALAVSIAIYYFSDATFWPVYVGGQGSTKYCWDLSGGLTVGFDGDFDHHNTVLKNYFLWQASYHWHSGAFHIISVLLLLLPNMDKAEQPKRRRLLNAVSLFGLSYNRRLMQHSIALFFIGSAYVFSSLRRLGAIGIFAFDVSSLFLHLLQVCVNAPESSRLRSPTVITALLWVVIPTFCFARFGIWGILWWSGIFESKSWLRQLELTLWDGAANQFRIILCLFGIAIEAFAVMYFRRLWNHPHLQGVKRRRRVEA